MWKWKVVLLCVLAVPLRAFAQEASSPRLIDNGDGTVSDNLTGLMWERAPSGARMNWAEANEHVEALTLAGHADWRLPERVELRSLLTSEDTESASWLNSNGFKEVQAAEYWAAGVFEWMGYTSPEAIFRWIVDMGSGGTRAREPENAYYVWAVRGQPWPGDGRTP
jgi:hypothetical protein